MRARTLGLALFAAGWLLGCDHATEDAKEGDTTAPAEQPAAKSPGARAVAAAVPAVPAVLEHVKLDAPGDWVRQARGGVEVFTAPDGLSVLAVAPLSRGDNVPSRLADVAKLLGATELHVADPQAITIGPDRLAAQAADGPCRFHDGDGRIAYADIDAGSGKRVLVIHLSAKDATSDASKTALTAVASLRKKD